jgi:hypothetical protein
MATPVAPTAALQAAGVSPGVKREAATDLVTKEHKRFRLALDSVADEYLCPITHELPLDPVMAEDASFYERAFIEEWLRRTESAVRSPITNAPMGRVLKALPQVRNTIQKLVDTGAIADEKANSWKIRLAQKAQEEEVKRMRQRATAGEAEARRTLGLWYLNGDKGLEKDLAQAFSWLKLAADAGNVMAMAHVGFMYCHGRCVTSNVTLGAARLGQAAALGSDYACYVLGKLHEEGSFGCHKDAAEASFYHAKIPGCTVKHLNDLSPEEFACYSDEYLWGMGPGLLDQAPRG